MTTDTDILSHPQGPLRTARDFPEFVNGWTRDAAWYNVSAADSCGDYAVGPSIETFYRQIMFDGRVLAIERVVYFEIRPEDAFRDGGVPADAEIFGTERVFYASAASVEAFENQDFDVEDYDYEPVGIMVRNLVDGEVATDDLNWLISEHGDTDDREYLNWSGEPIHG